MPTPAAPDSSPPSPTAVAPGTAVVIRRAAPALPVTAFVTRASGLGLGLAGAAARVAVESLHRIEGSTAPYAPPTVRPLGRILRAMPGLALASAYATRAGAIAVVARVEESVHRSATGLPAFVDRPLTPVADAVDDINRWAFGEQRYNEALLNDFVRRNAPQVAEQLVARIDLPHVVRELPVQAMVKEVDIPAVVASIDLNSILAGIDIRPLADQVIEELDIPSIVLATTGTMAGDITNASRIAFMRVDGVIGRTVDRGLRRRGSRTERLAGYDPYAPEQRRNRPEHADAAGEEQGQRHGTWIDPDVAIRSEFARGLQGARAGIASRAAAAVLDLGVLTALTFLGLVLFGFLRYLVSQHPLTVPDPGPTASLIIATVLGLVYYVGSWTTTGRTLGDAYFGLRVITERGQPVGWWAAVVRALLTMFVGPFMLAWCLVSKKNHALYDVLLHTTVVYDWTIN